MRTFSKLSGLALALSMFTGLAGCAATEAGDDAASEDELVGGRRDLRFAAGGYLSHSSSPDAVSCGATLIAPRVAVTAAHCVLAKKDGTWSYGVGEIGKPAAKVAEVHVHPNFHAEKQGAIDLTHALRKFDVAYVVLDRAVAGVTPAKLPEVAPKMGDVVQATGYSSPPSPKRRSTPAKVMVTLSLAGDPIFEVHPMNDSALCVADGDEGSAVFTGTGKEPVLVGFFVGSVTQGMTDCVRGSQYLNGYESAYGYREFFAEAIASVR
ncbi:MAG: trypsin-like serine protease [Myxococcales bacterium]|nr:trypsin-like serine protease [Myxococcales bacterium]